MFDQLKEVKYFKITLKIRTKASIYDGELVCPMCVFLKVRKYQTFKYQNLSYLWKRTNDGRWGEGEGYILRFALNSIYVGENIW